MGKTKADVGKENEFEEDELEEYFLLERNCGDPSSEGRLSEHVEPCDVPAELNEQLRLVMKALKKVQPDLMSDKRKRDEVHTSVIAKSLADRLAQYPTTADEDNALLKREDLSKRHRMAIKVRLGEKLLLGEALASLMGDEVETPAGSQSKRATKRTKS